MLAALQAMHGAEGPEVQEQVVLEGMRINKQVARDQINKSLPAPDAVIQMHQKVLIGLALASRDKRLRVSPEPYTFQLCPRLRPHVRRTGMQSPRDHPLHLGVTCGAVQGSSSMPCSPIRAPCLLPCRQKLLLSTLGPVTPSGTHFS